MTIIKYNCMGVLWMCMSTMDTAYSVMHPVLGTRESVIVQVYNALESNADTIDLSNVQFVSEDAAHELRHQYESETIDITGCNGSVKTMLSI